MEIQPQNTQPISDDQELAKVLAGVADQTEANDDPMALTNTLNSMSAAPSVSLDAMVSSSPAGAPVMPAPSLDEKKPDAEPVVTTPAPMSTIDNTASSEKLNDKSADSLESVKKGAITDLRPIMDKLSVEPDEMFDLYLLLIRSTDDHTLIEPAYAAAKKITDESRRAQALLDIIKEIDYLSNKGK